MQARMQDATRWTVATMMMLMSATTLANADPGAPNGPKARVVARFYESAWVKPLTVVLDSKEAWKEWNEQAVSNRWAVAAESAPEDVNWNSEVVLVVALGENQDATLSLDMTECRRNGPKTEVYLNCSTTLGGTSPAMVVALPRGLAKKVNLVSNLPLPVLQTDALYVTSGQATMADTGESPTAQALTWGALKADYR